MTHLLYTIIVSSIHRFAHQICTAIQTKHMKLNPIAPNTTNQTAGHPNSISRCGPNQFNCKSDPNACIEISLVCDEIYDCFDQSDEANCSPYTQFRNRTKKDDMAANKLARLIGL